MITGNLNWELAAFARTGQPRLRYGTTPLGYTTGECIYVDAVAKHLIDLDEALLSAARAELGTGTIKDTVNEALRRATEGRPDRIVEALEVLAAIQLDDRADAWH